MKQKIAYWFSLVCSGVDFWKDPPDADDNYNLDHFSMHGWQDDRKLMHVTKHDAWDRVAKNPFSFFHHWVNLTTSYMETPHQEPVAKLTGATMLIHGAITFAFGLLIGGLLL